MSLLEKLDNFVAPNGKLDSQAFKYLFDEYGEMLSSYTEPSDEDMDEWEPWNESTLKHQVFDYWPTDRTGGNYPKDINDLPWVISEYIKFTEDKETEEEILKFIEKYNKTESYAKKYGIYYDFTKYGDYKLVEKYPTFNTEDEAWEYLFEVNGFDRETTDMLEDIPNDHPIFRHTIKEIKEEEMKTKADVTITADEVLSYVHEPKVLATYIANMVNGDFSVEDVKEELLMFLDDPESYDDLEDTPKEQNNEAEGNVKPTTAEDKDALDILGKIEIEFQDNIGNLIGEMAPVDNDVYNKLKKLEESFLEEISDIYNEHSGVSTSLHPEQKGGQEIKLQKVKDKHLDEIFSLSVNGLSKHALLSKEHSGLTDEQINSVRKAIIEVGNRNMGNDREDGKGGVGTDIPEFATWVTSDSIGKVADYLIENIDERNAKDTYLFAFNKLEENLMDFYRNEMNSSNYMDKYEFWQDVIYNQKALGASEDDDFYTFFFKEPIEGEELEELIKEIETKMKTEVAVVDKSAINVYHINTNNAADIAKMIGQNKIEDIA